MNVSVCVFVLVRGVKVVFRLFSMGMHEVEIVILRNDFIFFLNSPPPLMQIFCLIECLH